MDKPYGHQVLDSSRCSAGIMRCHVCDGGIKQSEGELFLNCKVNKQGDWVYRNYHEQCSRNHPAWSEYRIREAEGRKLNQEFEADCLAFEKKWGFNPKDTNND